MTNNKGIKFITSATIVLIILKLLDVGLVANWSWWWVFSPLWVPAGLWALIVVSIVTYHILNEIRLEQIVNNMKGK